MSRDEGGGFSSSGSTTCTAGSARRHGASCSTPSKRRRGTRSTCGSSFEEARRWLSDEAPEEPAHGVEGIIERTRRPPRARRTTARSYVSHALGYLAASRQRLAEDKLLDLLSAIQTSTAGSCSAATTSRSTSRERLDERLPGQDVDEWIRQIREGERPVAELDDFLSGALARPRAPPAGRPLVASLLGSAPVSRRAVLRRRGADRLLSPGARRRGAGAVPRHGRRLPRAARALLPAGWDRWSGRQAWAAASARPRALPAPGEEAEGLGEELFATWPGTCVLGGGRHRRRSARSRPTAASSSSRPTSTSLSRSSEAARARVDGR